MKAIVCTDEVSAGAVALRYRLDGPPGGPVVVLSNSLGCSAAMWESQVEALTPYRRVLRYEHRGHGGAPAPAGPYSIADLGGDLIGLLDALGIEKAALGGLSLGGMVGMWVASHHPDRVDRLALMCTSPHMPPPSTWAERAAAVRTGGTEILLEGSLGRWFTAGFPERRPDVADLVRSMLGVAKPEGYAGCCEAIAGMDQRESIRSISVPTAVLAGAEDPSTPPAVGLGIAEAVPGASLTVVAGAAHLATLEQPARVSSWLVDHLVGTPLQRGDAIRRAVLGDAHVDRSKGAGSHVAASFTDYITRCAWGEVWARPGLDRRVRSCVTLGVLAALGRSEELVLHARGARRNGLTDEEIGEVLLHVAVYAGVPAANSAIATVREALADA